MATYVGMNLGIEKMMEAGNAGTDTWTCALVTAAPTVATDTTLVAEVANGNGYTTGGNSCAVTSSASTAGVYKLVLADPATWTASGAGFSFSHVVLYNSTLAQCIGYWAYGSTVTMVAGDTFTADLSAANGVFTIATP